MLESTVKVSTPLAPSNLVNPFSPSVSASTGKMFAGSTANTSENKKNGSTRIMERRRISLNLFSDNKFIKTQKITKYPMSNQELEIISNEID